MKTRNNRFVHFRDCQGGFAFDEVDNETYCLGLQNLMYEDIVYCQECKKCPKLLANNEEKIQKYIDEKRTKNKC